MATSFNHYSQLATAFHEACKQVVIKTAMDMAAEAASRAVRDTGFMANSIYTVTSEGSTYTGGSSKSLPQVPGPENDTTAYVAVGASYSLYVEMGTVHSPDQPFFYPAVEATRGPFEAALATIEDAMRNSV